MPKAVACKCPNCGAAISVQPVNGIMKCDYCQGAIQVAADEKGGVSLSIKHINIQGGTVQIADNLTVVHGDTAVTCSFCGKHNLKHHTFRCRKCKADDLCTEHQSSSGICKWCREEEIAEADARYEKELAKENARRAKEQAESSRRQTKTCLIVLGSVVCVVFFACVLVPAIIWMFFGAAFVISQISGTAWVIIVGAILAIGVLVGTALILWYKRNTFGETDSEEDDEDDEEEDDE